MYLGWYLWVLVDHSDLALYKRNPRRSRGNQCKTFLDSWSRFPGTGFRILCQLNLDSGFQSLVGSGFLEFRIPKPRIPDSTKHFPDSRIRMPLHGATDHFSCLLAHDTGMTLFISFIYIYSFEFVCTQHWQNISICFWRDVGVNSPRAVCDFSTF